MKENLKAACTDFAGQIFERNNVTQALEERLALAMYKIDEACAFVDAHVDLETDEETRESIALLLHRSDLLQRQFRAIDHMERIVDAMAASTKQVQDRMEAVQKHAEPILNPTQISAMLKRTLALGRKVCFSINHVMRSYCMQKASGDVSTSTTDTITWEPVTLIPNTATCMKRLDEIMTHDPDPLAATFMTPSITAENDKELGKSV
ncbi:hypothetical protein DYB25_003435 [Aphanomyces astaci]|uniref:Uncharacterized protein n=1 Tax=Aphanomyces astaci TaxID=112090 RepID=A0A397BIN2_APHAT|nr:hypothetical protein DYB25_003435 [Aphanomyces astaci]RHY45040.1 hypothetical protein DYB30_000709 [Aphanomyces astaci]RHZ41781.1 hypothetical protein DYB31_000695 [Aphanomyces astaci]